MTEQTNIEKFEDLLQSIKREGVNDLLDFIRKSDFYTAPASTRYHSCHEGGLLEHTLNVYDVFMHKVKNPIWSDFIKDIDEDTFKIAPLLHDICKTYFYKPEWKNKKVYSDNGSKRDEGGRFDWQTVQGWSVDDKIPYGHGEKSVMICEQYIELKPIERYMIRWHMGFSEPKENWNVLGAAIKKYPLILALHEADLEATYLIEKEE